MGGRGCRLAIILVLGSCAAPGANRRFDESVAGIEERWEDARKEIEAIHRAELARLDEIEKGLVAIEPDSHSAPRVRVGERDELTAIDRQCAALGPANPGAAACWAGYQSAFAAALVSTYWAADVDWIVSSMKQAGDDKLDVEATFVYSHNLRLRAYLADRRAAEEIAYSRARRESRGIRDGAIASAMAQRDAENAAFRRRMAGAILAGVAGAANSRGPIAATGCSSDYACGPGYACVKANYSATGTCAHGEPVRRAHLRAAANGIGSRKGAGPI